jgi:FKBP-type peptidyl-prolyl cis-trans isomerase (trigger factor)
VEYLTGRAFSNCLAETAKACLTAEGMRYGAPTSSDNEEVDKGEMALLKSFAYSVFPKVVIKSTSLIPIYE